MSITKITIMPMSHPDHAHAYTAMFFMEEANDHYQCYMATGLVDPKKHKVALVIRNAGLMPESSLKIKKDAITLEEILLSDDSHHRAIGRAFCKYQKEPSPEPTIVSVDIGD